MKIIDSHVHVFEPSYNDEKSRITTADGRVLELPFLRRNCCPDCLLRDMEAAGIDKAVVVALEGQVTTEALADIVSEHNDRLVGFAYMPNPFHPEEAPAVLEHAVLNLGLKGMKLLPGAQGISPDDPSLFPLYETATDLHAPIFIHMYPWPPGSFDVAKPELIFSLKKQMPEVPIIVGHMGFPRFNDLLALWVCKNTYVETSIGLNQIVQTYGIQIAENILRTIGIERVVFGSDWSGTPERMTQTLNIIDDMSFSSAEKARILGDNIDELLESVG